MLTTEHLLDYMRREIAESRLAGDAQRLWEAQRAAGFLMAAAEDATDPEAARAFHLLAAEAANVREGLLGDDD